MTVDTMTATSATCERDEQRVEQLVVGEQLRVPVEREALPHEVHAAPR